ncbi:MAG: septal ring lytic transglycosylase RlpA family protein [Burkholderiaceae bacterium]
MNRHALLSGAALFALAACLANGARAGDDTRLDRSGQPRRGEASYYGKEFAGRTMADGTPMQPDANAAASKTLPLGTEARVTNLENGKSATVEIRDRGPYVAGRIIDVTPKVAKTLEMKKEGVAPVVVKPIDLPPPDNGKPGK